MASNDSITNAMILGAILTHIADQKNPCLVTLSCRIKGSSGKK